MNFFPQELDDHIIDFLHDDRESLRRCSLVRKSWVDASRHHLFSAVTIELAWPHPHRTYDALSRFFAVADLSALYSRQYGYCPIYHFVRKLTLKKISKVAHLDIRQMGPLLERLPKLRSLTLEGVLPINPQTVPVPKSSPGLELEELSLSNIIFEEFGEPFVCFWQHFSKIEMLKICKPVTDQKSLWVVDAHDWSAKQTAAVGSVMLDTDYVGGPLIEFLRNVVNLDIVPITIHANLGCDLELLKTLIASCTNLKSISFEINGTHIVDFTSEFFYIMIIFTRAVIVNPCRMAAHVANLHTHPSCPSGTTGPRWVLSCQCHRKKRSCPYLRCSPMQLGYSLIYPFHPRARHSPVSRTTRGYSLHI